jgi:hypothetical protein
MEKEKSKKKSAQHFSGCKWPITIRRPGQDPVTIGDLHLEKSSGEPSEFVGTLTFGNDRQLFGPVYDWTAHVEISVPDHVPGTISFYLKGASERYNGNDKYPDQFAFVGFYFTNDDGLTELRGEVKIPANFANSGDVGEDGDVIPYTSQAVTDPKPKDSK